MDFASLTSGLTATSSTSSASSTSKTAGSTDASRSSTTASGAASKPSTLPTSRSTAVTDPGYITVEPDGRDDVTFRDRLLQAIKGFFDTFQANSEEQTQRALASIEDSVSAAEQGGEPFFVQFRVTSIEVTLAEEGDQGGGFASIRQLGLEIGVARGGKVEAADTRVLDLAGQSVGLTADQIRAGLGKPNFERRDTGTQSSERAAKRLEAAQASLDRVTQVQDALKAYRGGDIGPLQKFFETSGSSGSNALGSLSSLFPSRGAFSIDA